MKVAARHKSRQCPPTPHHAVRSRLGRALTVPARASQAHRDALPRNVKDVQDHLEQARKAEVRACSRRKVAGAAHHREHANGGSCYMWAPGRAGMCARVGEMVNGSESCS